jgi:hypothetical protein
VVHCGVLYRGPCETHAGALERGKGGASRERGKEVGDGDDGRQQPSPSSAIAELEHGDREKKSSFPRGR